MLRIRAEIKLLNVKLDDNVTYNIHEKLLNSDLSKISVVQV